jgi:hypothetical protein
MVYWGFPAKLSQLGPKTNIATIWREVEDIKIGKKLLNLAFYCNYAVWVIFKVFIILQEGKQAEQTPRDLSSGELHLM